MRAEPRTIVRGQSRAFSEGYGKFRSVSRSFFGETPIAFQKPRNEYEIGPQKGRGAHARIRTGDLFLTKEMLYRLSYVGGAAASEF